jgi:hypothetical protein
MIFDLRTVEEFIKTDLRKTHGFTEFAHCSASGGMAILARKSSAAG